MVRLVAGRVNFDANGGLANSIPEAALSGLSSLELLKLVTSEEGFEKLVADSSEDGCTIA